MGAAENIPRVSFEQFLGLLDVSQTKLEWLDGIAYAMAGGSFDHSRLASKIGAVLTAALIGKPCVALQSDMLVKATNGFAAFPDASVVCGPPVLTSHEKTPALLNPKVIVEVLSPSTESFDRGEKFARYQSIDSLEEYVLVSSDRRIEVFSRANGWRGLTYGPGEEAALPSVGVTLSVDEVHFNPLTA